MTTTLQAKPQLILDKLIQAAPEPVDRWELVDMLKPGACEDRSLRLYICRIRARFGYDCIKNVYGYGYTLTESGRQAVMEIAA